MYNKQYLSIPLSDVNTNALRPYLLDAPRPKQRDPQLTGFACLRCDAHYPLALVHTGCIKCASLGARISLRANYRKQLGVSRYIPYTQGVSLGEGNTPLTESNALAQTVGVAYLHIKDESHNPTGSHKDRMSAIGITQALDFGAHTVVLASSGNAAVSAAHYAQATGLSCEVATFKGMPAAYEKQLDNYAAKRFAFADNESRWAFVAQRARQPGYFALTNYHLPALGSAPLAIEGYKAIAYECYASSCVPEHIMVPTARGDLAWGVYAGFADLLEAKQIDVLPKVWIVEPFARLSLVLGGSDLHGNYVGSTAQFSTAGGTVTYLQWQAATASGGGAVVVPDDLARQARQLLAKQGYSAELCAGAGLAAAQQLRQNQKIAAHESVLLILTANASNDPSWPDPI
jgi:threonine synthase